MQQSSLFKSKGVLLKNMTFQPHASVLIFSLILLVLTGCGSTEIMKNVDETYTVAAQYGSANGSWDRASKEANERALVYCEGKGLKLFVMNERRDGIWGVSPQRAEVKFTCRSSNASIPNPDLKASLEERLSELKGLYQKGLITKEQYDLQVSRTLSGN